MRNRPFKAELWSLAIAVAAVFLSLYLLCLAVEPQSPTFVIYDEKNPREAVAVYVGPVLLKENNVSAEKFETAFREECDVVARIVAHAVTETFSGNSHDEKSQQIMSSEDFHARFGFSAEAFRTIMETIRIECWVLHPNGTHTVSKTFTRTTRTGQ